MKNLIFLLALPIIIISCQNNDSNYPEYYRTYNQVLNLEKEDKIQEAFNLFKENEQFVDFIPVQHLLKARSFAIRLGHCKVALEYFQKAVDNGFEFQEFVFDNELCPEINNSSLTKIMYDEEYREAVNSIFEKDQAIRKGTIDGELEKIDSLNIQQLLSLIERKGYPHSQIIGSKAAGKAFIVMLHFDADIGNEILGPIIEKAYHQGMIEPASLAWVIDRRRYWGPEKIDPYYYQLPSEKYFEMTEKEIAIIDERRDSIGLKSLKEMNITRNENGGISIQF